MGKSLYENVPVARAYFDRADEALGWNLSRLCFEGPETELTQTSVCQPALFVHGCAVAAALQERGSVLEPSACLGLSLGELTALTVAQAFSFEDGLRVVAERGRLMQQACEQTDGAMASMIGGEFAKVQTLCEEHDIDIANLNCAGQIVVSGERHKVEAAVEAAQAGGGFRMVVPLKVAGAYHSRLMEPAREAFERFLAEVPVAAPKVPVFSNTTGAQVQDPDAIRAALVRQVVSSVRWEDCMRSAAALGIETFYECGPGTVLTGLARRIDRSVKVFAVAEHEQLPSA